VPELEQNAQAASLKPIREIRPADSGGSVARAGFAFQDHVTASFCIEMLVQPSLKEVWCETYDDVVLVWSENGSELIEFVQVKSDKHDQLWTPSLLCQREKRKEESGKLGTSIPERSLSRDCCAETACFRLVTAWEVSNDLRILKLSREHADRSPTSSAFKELVAQIQPKIGEYKSTKGHGCDSWLERLLWQVEAQDPLEKTNCLKLIKALHQLGISIHIDAIGGIYAALLTLVKEAAQRPDSEREKKFLKADRVRDFLRENIDPFPHLGPSKTLDAKLIAAGLPATDSETAQELRRAYLKAIRTQSYLETDGHPAFANSILYQLLRLRAAHDSGVITPMDGVRFHEMCLARVEETMKGSLGANDSTPLSLGAGCMYDITARCQHRFTRLTT
jgi:hypothetical protein